MYRLTFALILALTIPATAHADWYTKYHSGSKAAKKRAHHHYSRRASKRIIRWMAKRKHENARYLLDIAKHESGYRARCKTGSYYGLFQLKRKRSWSYDPYYNTSQAIKYMRNRHGSVKKAYQFRRRHGWY